MRRKRRRKKTSIIKIIFFVTILMSVVSFGYSYLSSVLKIIGHVSGEYSEQNYTLAPGSDPTLAILVTQTNTWQEGGIYKYQYSLRVTNVGTATVDNFKITLEFLNTIESVDIWNYSYSISNKTLTITNDNYILASSQSTTVDFIMSAKTSDQRLRTAKLEVINNSNVITPDKFDVKFDITGSWGNYTYQYNVTVTNKTGTKINGWQLDITLPTNTTFVSGWSAIYNFGDNILTIKNETYNGKLNNNSSTTFGLQLSTDIVNYIPNSMVITVR